MIFLGIDNGLSGGIVAIDENQKVIIKRVMPVIKGKKTEYNIQEINNIFNSFGDSAEVCVALEKAHVRPVSGKRASFMCGFGYGVMQALIEAKGFSYEIVNPTVWMKEILKGMDTTDKKASIMFCKRKWPKEDWRATERCTKEHDGLTDSACLALYAYRQNG